MNRLSCYFSFIPYTVVSEFFFSNYVTFIWMYVSSIEAVDFHCIVLHHQFFFRHIVHHTYFTASKYFILYK